MVRVAVAGGSGGIGLTIVEAILATKKHEVFILSRSNSAPVKDGVTILQIDYSSTENIANTLNEHAIHTIISALSLQTEEGHISQLNLINGAASSGVVCRFAPSEFGIDYVEAERRNYPFDALTYKLTALATLKSHPSLHHTRFINGMFMDYLGASTPHPSHLNLVTILLDLVHSLAAIPSPGTTIVTFTHSTTVAAYVAAALDLETWPEASLIRGERIAVRDLVAVAEKVKGEEFTKTFDELDDLKAGRTTELPSNVPRYAFIPRPFVEGVICRIMAAMAEGMLDPQDGTELSVVLPEVEVLGVEEFFKRCLGLVGEVAGAA